MIPLAAVGLVMAGYAVERLNDARDHGATARTAQAARDIGALIQTLQQERLLALGYLAVPTLQRSALVDAEPDGGRRRGPARRRPAHRRGHGERRAPALDALAIDPTGRDQPRPSPPRWPTTPSGPRTPRCWTACAWATTRPPTRTSLRELVALDALMRSNEEASSVGAILVAARRRPGAQRDAC